MCRSVARVTRQSSAKRPFWRQSSAFCGRWREYPQVAEVVDADTPTATTSDLPIGSAQVPRRVSSDALSRYALPVFVIAVFFLIWQFVPKMLGFTDIELPNLTDTLADLQSYWSDIGSALLVTIQDALVGFIIGNGLAILGATSFVWFRSLERAFYPIAIIIQTIPIIVYAPIFVLIFYKVPFFRDHPEAPSVVLVAVLIT